MDTRAAITEFSQSEKIKAGLIWATHALDFLPGNTHTGDGCAERVVRTMVAMIGHEVQLARKASGENAWMDVEKNIDMAMVMIDSGVASEAAYHLTRALSQTTNRAQQAMAALRDRGLI